MKILLNSNEVFELDFVPDEIDDIRYCILDYSNIEEPDYYFVPLVFLETFNSPAAVLKIGNHMLKMPMGWKVIICDDEGGEPEIISILHTNDRGFKAFCLNPISSMLPEYQPIDIVDIYQDSKWHFPKLRPGHILAVPLTDQDRSLCAFFVNETNKLPDQLDLGLLW